MKRMTKQAATNRIHKLASVARLVKCSRAMRKIAEECEGTSGQPELNSGVSRKLKKKKPINTEVSVSKSGK